jgi:hypothetical protein
MAVRRADHLAASKASYLVDWKVSSTVVSKAVYWAAQRASVTAVLMANMMAVWTADDSVENWDTLRADQMVLLTAGMWAASKASSWVASSAAGLAFE